jgi:MFS family permease
MKFFGSVNTAIKILVFGNVATNMADGIFSPIFAVFVTQKIAPGSVSVVGFAIAIYWFVKSVIQLPLARFLDRTDGERDDYIAMRIGGALYVVMPLFFLLIQEPWQLYLLQLGYAVAASLYVVPWASLFTRHVDKFRIGFEWSLNSSALGFGLMAASALGGFLADRFGFNSVFILASLFNLISFVTFIFLGRYITQRDRLKKAFPETRRQQ